MGLRQYLPSSSVTSLPFLTPLEGREQSVPSPSPHQ